MTDVRERFRAWVEADPRSRVEIGAAVGCDSTYISRLLTGEDRWPGRRVANGIERESAGWKGGPIRSEEWDQAEAELKATGTEG